jgi:acetyl-CoA carboxylase carboxyltransferase component
VDGCTVFLYAQDLRPFGSPLGQTHAEKIYRVMDPAIQTGSPLFSPDDDGGARIQEMREVIAEIVDAGEFMEVQPLWVANVIGARARIDGRTAGWSATSRWCAGLLDINSAEKAARFVRTCDTFDIRPATLVDMHGFRPGADQEHDSVIRHGAKLLYAYCDATVPRVRRILRKAYGGAYIAMESRSTGADVSVAWPGNEIAVMGAQGAVSVLHGRKLAVGSDPASLRAKLVPEREDVMMHPCHAAERGLIDDVIDPCETRSVIARALARLERKHPDPIDREHGNPPT